MKKMGKAMYGKTMMKSGGDKKPKMMTGGMANSNAKISVDKTPGSKGTTVGLNPKATVTPKAKYGMSMKPGMMKRGGAKKK
jgi:hypothetical protein